MNPIIPKEFEPCSSSDISTMFEKIGQMRDVLYLIEEGEVSNSQSLVEDLYTYCCSLVQRQRENLGRTVAGSWSVAPNDDQMGSDARVDFIFVPTYLIIAILVRLKIDFPKYANKIDGLDDALQRGMHFASLRKLQGHGIDGEQGKIDALMIFASGKVYQFLKSNPEFYPKLLNLLEKIGRDAVRRLDTGETADGWGQDLHSGYRAIAETLYLLQDEQMKQAVDEGMAEPIERCSREPGW